MNNSKPGKPLKILKDLKLQLEKKFKPQKNKNEKTKRKNFYRVKDKLERPLRPIESLKRAITNSLKETLKKNIK